MSDQRAEDHKSLMAKFLAAIEDYGPEEASDLTGINRESIRLYREGSWARLTAATQRKMRAFIEGRRPDDPMGYKAGVRAALEKVRGVVDELEEMLGATERPSDDAADAADAAEAIRADAESPPTPTTRPKKRAQGQ